MNRPAKLEVGARVGHEMWNGARWVPAPFTAVTTNVVVFTQSGPYLPSAGVTSVTVECWGAGGGGGGVLVDAVSEIFFGAGGGSGGYSRKTLAAALVQGGVNVTIGAGGAGGGGVGQAPSGGATSFGGLCVANGGVGGWGVADMINAPEPGAGAPAGIGDLAFPGASGQGGLWRLVPAPENNATPSPLGGAILGGAQSAVISYETTSVNGLPGLPNTGAGGGGGGVNQSAAGSSAFGGAGGSGLCVVTETLVSDGLPPEDDWLNVNARVAVTQIPWTGPGPCPPGWGTQPCPPGWTGPWPEVEYDGGDE